MWYIFPHPKECVLEVEENRVTFLFLASRSWAFKLPRVIEGNLSFCQPYCTGLITLFNSRYLSRINVPMLMMPGAECSEYVRMVDWTSADDMVSYMYMVRKGIRCW